MKIHKLSTALCSFFSFVLLFSLVTCNNPYMRRDLQDLMNARERNNPTPDTSWYIAGNTSFDLDTAEKLAGLAQLVIDGNEFAGVTINLTSNISLAAYRNGHGWTPISLGDEDGGGLPPFRGTFNGNGKIISGLTINAPRSSVNYGLFGSIVGGTVKDLGLINVNINVGQTGNLSTGGITGFLHASGTVERCFVMGNIRGNNNVGGLVGWNHGNVINSYFIGSVSGRDYVGGLVGVTNLDTTGISYCYAAGGRVRGSNRVGGLAGGQYVSGTPFSILLNSVALNQRIERSSGSAGYFGRILGYIGGPPPTSSMTNNYGLVSMILPSGISTDFSATGKDGADVSTAQAGDRDWWTGSPGWTVYADKNDAIANSQWWWDDDDSRPRLWFE